MGGQALSSPRESNSILCGSVRASEVDFSVSVSEPQPEPLLAMSKVLRQRAGQGIVGPVAMPTPLLGVGSEKMTGMLPTGQSAASKVRPRGKKSEPERYVCTGVAHSEISDDLLSGISTTQPLQSFAGPHAMAAYQGSAGRGGRRCSKAWLEVVRIRIRCTIRP
jgi:hypothetical protein